MEEAKYYETRKKIIYGLNELGLKVSEARLNVKEDTAIKVNKDKIKENLKELRGMIAYIDYLLDNIEE